MVNSHRICGGTEIFEGFRVSWFENQTRNPSMLQKSLLNAILGV